jgi:integrase
VNFGFHWISYAYNQSYIRCGSFFHIRIKTGFAKDSKGHLTNTISQREEQVINFIWELKKAGLAEATIKNYSKSLDALMKNGAVLSEPESIKVVLASSSWSNSTKAQIISAYKRFAVMNLISWTPPKCKIIRKLPHIPTEQDIDELISSCGKKLSTILQLLKESGMRIGECLSLEWNDVDLQQRTCVLNNPEKNGTPRMFKLSEKLVAMLNRLSTRDSCRVFGDGSWPTVRNNFNAQRKRSANKLGNQRLLKIHFHSLRHWKASTEYHRTKDILYVMHLLGHKNINNTLIYTQLIEAEDDDKYCSAVAHNVEEAQKLIEAGFEYVCNHENVMLFRKRK